MKGSTKEEMERQYYRKDRDGHCQYTEAAAGRTIINGPVVISSTGHERACKVMG